VLLSHTDILSLEVSGLRGEVQREGRPGVVAVGVAQEFQNVFTGTKRPTAADKAVQFAFRKEDRRVACFYFYVWDNDFGPGFIKLCAYFPYPGKVWVNGHEWAKRQAVKAGIGFTALSNGFAACDDPARLQKICDQLGPNQILAFFERWLRIVPTPLNSIDRAGGYWWELSMRQIEVSRKLVFDAPRHARALFEAVVRDNLDLGRPTRSSSSSPARPAGEAVLTSSHLVISSRPRSSPPVSSTPASSNTSKTGVPGASRRSSTHPTTSVSSRG
jgi:hypothetical protein